MKKTIKLCKVRPGDAFTLDGVDFVKLADDQGSVFALTADVILKNIQFEKEGTSRKCHNDFNGSNLCADIYRWVLSEHDVIYDAITTRSIDLATMDGMTDYGYPPAFARALTIDEYRKYRRFIPLTDEPYWLATGWTTKSSPNSNADHAYYVETDGTPCFNLVHVSRFAARPAFYLKYSVLVSVPDYEEESVLADFSDTDLLDELCRRRHQT